MGRLMKMFLTRFQAALVTICSWAGSSQSCFYPTLSHSYFYSYSKPAHRFPCPYVFTFVHLYYLPYLHYLATYIGTTQIRIFVPVQQSLLLSLSRKPIGPSTCNTFRSNEPEPHPNGHCCYCGQRLLHQDRAPRRIQV